MPYQIHLTNILSFPNQFYNDSFKILNSLSSIKNGTVYLDRPNLNKIQNFCKKRDCELIISSDVYQIYQKNFTANISQRKTLDYIIKFETKVPLHLNNEIRWNQLTQKLNSKYSFEYVVEFPYQLLLAIDYLIISGYFIEYPSTLSWIDEQNRYHGVCYDTIYCKFTPMPHQIENVERFFSNNSCGFIIADDPGTGKTLSSGLIIKQLFELNKIKNTLWVVPSHSLAQQVSDEIMLSFGISSQIISGKTVSKASLKYDKNNSPYLKAPLVITTWKTFQEDFGKHFDKMKYFNFDLAVFDECHCIKYDINENREQTKFWFTPNMTIQSVQNCCTKYRIGLTGTPAPNGHWVELYSVISVIDPFSLKPFSTYIQSYKNFVEFFISDPVMINKKKEPATVSANNAMNEQYISVFKDSPSIIRHSRNILTVGLPIVESEEIHIPFTSDESLIYNELSDILDQIKEQCALTSSSVYQNARKMIWQYLRRYSAYGKKELEKTILNILNKNKNDEYNGKIIDYVNSTFNSELTNIYNELQEPRLRELPKLEKLVDLINSKSLSNYLIFVGDSVETALLVANALSKKGFETKVIVGSDEKVDQNTVDAIYKELNQLKPSEAETINIINWFWSPYKELILLQTILETQSIQIYRNDQLTESIHLFNLLTASKIEYKISGDLTLHLKLLTQLKNEIIAIDPLNTFELTSNTCHILFRPLSPFRKKILVCTDKLATGVNLQIAGMIVFYNYPFSPSKYDQKLSRIRRIGSPYARVYMYSLLMGNENGIQSRLNKKYNNIKCMGYSKNPNVKPKKSSKKTTKK